MDDEMYLMDSMFCQAGATDHLYDMQGHHIVSWHARTRAEHALFRKPSTGLIVRSAIPTSGLMTPRTCIIISYLIVDHIRQAAATDNL
jgi:hypothetical protein